MFTPETPIKFTNIGHDINGNRRIVCSWLSIPGAGSYAEAVKIAHKIGGRKYHTKQYGGGIVFQGNPSEVQYNIDTILKGR